MEEKDLLNRFPEYINLGDEDVVYDFGIAKLKNG